MTDHSMFGKLGEKVGVRDAIHVATVSVVAGERLKPGQKVSRQGDLFFATASGTDAI